MSYKKPEITREEIQGQMRLPFPGEQTLVEFANWAYDAGSVGRPATLREYQAMRMTDTHPVDGHPV